MLKINIICIGKIKEKYLKDAIAEYSKRLCKYCNLNIIELPDSPIPEKTNLSIENQIKDFESSLIIEHIPKESFKICLDLSGKNYSSEQFAKHINDIQLNNSSISFIIGGSLGVNDTLKNICNEKICFSSMTLEKIILFLCV